MGYLMQAALLVILGCVSLTTCYDETTISSTARIDKFGESVLLGCGEDTSERAIFEFWLLPDLRTLDLNNHGGDLTIVHNKSLYIPRVEMEHLGDYICFRGARNKTVEIYKTTVYLYVPPLWEIYRMNVIIGGAAAGAFLVLMTIFCCIHSYRWESKQTAGKPEDVNGGVELINSYPMENHAYSQDNTDYPMNPDIKYKTETTAAVVMVSAEEPPPPKAHEGTTAM